MLTTREIDQIYNQNGFVRFFKKKGIKVNRAQSSMLREQIVQSFDDESATTVLERKGSKLSSFYQFFKDTDLNEKVIICEFDITPKLSLKDAKSLIKRVGDKDRRIKKLQFYLPYGCQLQSQLESLGAKNCGLSLLGQVCETYEYLNKYDFLSSVKIQDMLKEDLNEVVNLDISATRASDSTRCGNLARKVVKGLYEWLLKSNKKVIIAREDDRIIGVISLSQNSFGIAHIMTIAVHPSDQGRGVSKLLYFEAMKYLKKNKVKSYSGVSTTDQVLHLAKRMKRSPQNIYLENQR